MECTIPPRQMVPGFFVCLAVVFVSLLCVCHAATPYAKNSYYMDSSSDCYISGYLLIQTDGVVNILSRKPDSSGSSELSCTVRFKPEDDRDIIDVSFTHLTISDKDVTLRVVLTGDVQRSGAGSYTLSRGSPKPDKMESTGGIVTVSLTRLNLEDHDYSFGVIVRVYKEDNTVLGDDEKPVGVGLVVGIVGGIIVFLIFIAVLAVCCYRRKRDHNGIRGGDDYKVDLTSSSHSPSHRFGLDNTAAQNGNYLPGGKEEESLPVKKKPLTSQAKPSQYRDQSDSESDSTEDVRKFSGSPTNRGGVMRYENERDNPYGDQRGMRRKREPAENIRRDILYGDRKGLRRKQEGTETSLQRESSHPANQSLPPKSPILSALQSNPRFRASFHAAEQEAEERAQRMSGKAEDDLGNESDASMTETWNTTFDTNFDDDPRPPAGTFIKPPSLPPVPMSPHEVVRRENVASIHRAPRPSSSSSEIEHLQNGDGPVSMNPEGAGPPCPAGEIVPIRVQDPHSPSIRRKADAQRSVRPDADELYPNSASSQSSEPPLSNPSPKKSATSKSKIKQDKSNTGRKSKTKKSADPENNRDKVRNRPQEVKDKPREAGSEYEDRFKKSDSIRKSKSKSPRIGRSRSTRTDLDDADPYAAPRVTADDYEDSDAESNYRGRFKKSDSARKSKSKSPRIGRSRSTGTGLEDTESIGQPGMPRGYQAVPRVTADDFEDSDVDSDYNPLRRTGSKNSLYASRSSLYNRRRRKNSAGESVYSFATHDDMDCDPQDRDSFKERSLSRRGSRPFRSLGDLEMELRDQKTRSTQTLRECATQTGKGFANVSPGRKMVMKKSKPRSLSSSQTQTTKPTSHNLDSSSSSSGVTRPRERKHSASSTSSARQKSRDRANFALSESSERGKQRKNNLEGRTVQRGGEDSRRPEMGQEKPKPKPKARRALASAGRNDDDLESIRTGMTGPVDQSSMVGGGQQGGYPPQNYPGGYPVAAAGYPAHMAYMQATGQPPVMMPLPQAGGVPQQPGSVLTNPAAVAVSASTITTAPPAAKPSKWDMLCQMTGGDTGHGGGRGDSNDSASVAGSVFSNPYLGHQFPGHAYPGSAMSDYAASEQSGPTRSLAAHSQGFNYTASQRSGPSSRSAATAAGKQGSRSAGRSAWDALKEMTDQESQYAPSESNI